MDRARYTRLTAADTSGAAPTRLRTRCFPIRNLSQKAFEKGVHSMLGSSRLQVAHVAQLEVACKQQKQLTVAYFMTMMTARPRL